MSVNFGFDEFLGKLPPMPSSGATAPSSTTTIPSTADPINIIMSNLKLGPKTIRDLVPLVGTPGLAVQTVEKLSLLGYAKHQEGDYFTLTTSGQEAAALLKNS